MRFFVGLDGGGTGCRAQAQLDSGQRTAVFQGGPANVFSDPEGATAQIGALLRQCCDAAQALAPSVGPDPAAVVLGLAGASESGAEPMLRAALPYSHLHVLGDIDITLSGALQARDGIVVAIGTGSVMARQQAGTAQRLGGYGFLLGDEASGAWLGRRALSAALHTRDGLAPASLLSDLIWQRFRTVAGILDFVRHAHPADFAALAPLVLDHDSAGCPMACAILDDGCAYLQQAITVLQAGNARLPVAATGGLGPTLLDRLCAGPMPDLRRTAPLGGALDGALWRARSLDTAQEKDNRAP